MRFEFGVLVPFPFADRTAVNQRPAVVVGNANYNRLEPDLVLMAVTSQLRAAAAFGGVRGAERTLSAARIWKTTW
jgi:mRNA-degrading endonuclease toxin of MazEF toxin-antitoxin module